MKLYAWACEAACCAILIAQPPWACAQVQLNNLVTEFVNAENPQESAFAFEFETPGWIFVRTYEAAPGTIVTLGTSDAVRLIEYDQKQPAVQESMRYLEAGKHVVNVEKGRVGRIQIRRIPEIRYCRFQYDPWVFQDGPLDWAFLEQHMLPHVNTIVGTEKEDQSKYAGPWRSAGKRWIIETLAPGLNPPKAGEAPMTSDEVYAALMKTGINEHAWIDGLLVDEYLGHMSHVFEPTVTAVRRVHAEPRFAHKRIDLYVADDSSSAISPDSCPSSG